MFFKSNDSPTANACIENIDSDGILLDQMSQAQLMDEIAKLKQTREALRLNESRLESLVRTAQRKSITDPELVLNDKVTGGLNINSDISEQSRIETSLRESEHHFRTLTENSPNMIIRYDRECRRIYVNPTYIRELGILAEQAENVALDKQWLPNMNISAEMYKTKLQNVMATGTPTEILLEWTRKDRSYVTSHLIHVVPEKTSSGKTIGCLAIGHNISRLKAAEFRMAKLAETSPGVMFTILHKPDGTACMPYVSPRIEELNGLSPEILAEDLSGLYAWIHPEDVSRVLKSIEDSASALTTWHEEFRVRHPVKGEVWVEGRSTPVSQMDGSVQCFGFFHDITERKNTEKLLHNNREQLASMATKLSLAEERERRRIAAVLHDHIGQILLLSKIKLESLVGGKDDKTHREIEELLAQAINDVRSLTQELNPPLLAEVGLEAAIKSLANKMKADYSLSVDFCDDGSTKPLSEEARAVLYQSARELLINVAKHAGTSYARLTTGRAGDVFTLIVDDQGGGFACTPCPNTNVHQESSFGLFNIRQRIKHLGGEMKIESEPGRGTCVTLRVPLTDG